MVVPDPDISQPRVTRILGRSSQQTRLKIEPEIRWLPLVAISDQGVSGDASTWRNFRLFMRRPSIVPLFVSGKPEFHPQQLAHICVEPVLQIAQAGDGPTPAHSARSLEVRQQIWRQKQAAYHNPCLQHHEAEWFLFAKFQVPYAHS